MNTMTRVERAAPWLAALLFAAALLVFGAASPDFSHVRHPVALLGAHGEPNALAFNLSGFVVPGLLLAWRAFAWRSLRADANLLTRIGLQLLLLSALAFAAQGVLPLDPTNLVAPASRVHATAWTLWWIAFAPGALCIGIASRRWAGLALALGVPALALFGALAMPAPLAQRIAVVAWFGWWCSAGSWLRK